MTTATAAIADPKPYHHGDLRRALLEAAMVIIERDGPSALTLRAVAREAGVSPAAPYHHFKDKGELLYAVAKEGFHRLKQAMANASGPLSTHAMGVAYVEFAQANPALYRVMYDCARSMDKLPDSADHDEGGLKMLRENIRAASGGKISDIDLELTVIAAWCAAHGLAEISTFPEFKPLKEALGGERAFLTAVFEHLGYSNPVCTTQPNGA
jgi:AcrR family transcriptional regulator